MYPYKLMPTLTAALIGATCAPPADGHMVGQFRLKKPESYR
jgi:hypothetical protein